MRVGGLGIAAALTIAHSWACVIIYPSVRVGPNFQVKVEDRGRPVQGLQVVAGRTLRATTDENGLAHFRGVPPGSYGVATDRDDGVPDGVNLEVSRDGPVGVTVPLR